MLGYRDSEVAAVISDSETIDIMMVLFFFLSFFFSKRPIFFFFFFFFWEKKDGKPYKAGKKIFELRCTLFEEHLGIENEKKIMVNGVLEDGNESENENGNGNGSRNKNENGSEIEIKIEHEIENENENGDGNEDQNEQSSMPHPSIIDPLSKEFLQDVWFKTSVNNTK